jgi:hypothetical protein
VDSLELTKRAYLFTLGGDGVGLINEDDDRRIFLDLLNRLSQMILTLPRHLTHNLRTINQEEARTSFVCKRPVLRASVQYREDQTVRCRVEFATGGLEQLRVWITVSCATIQNSEESLFAKFLEVLFPVRYEILEAIAMRLKTTVSSGAEYLIFLCIDRTT